MAVQPEPLLCGDEVAHDFVEDAWVAFASCAEEDSSLHPVIPDRALNLVTRVSDTSGSRQIVQ
jgi:hypothetical protein